MVRLQELLKIPPDIAAETVPFPEPQPDIRFRRRINLKRCIIELVQARELVWTLAERDLRARYKQALLGISWAVITPVLLMIVFSVFFQKVANVDTQGAPYPLFSYLGLLPWTFFSVSVSGGGMSLVQNLPLLNRVYCPREVFPIAGVLVAGIGTLISSAVLIVLYVSYGVLPGRTALWVLVLIPVQVAFTLGITLLISAAVVYWRDIRHALPIALQLGIFATPVAYGMDAIPKEWTGVYVAANPLAAVIDGYRRTLLMQLPPNGPLLLISGLSSMAFLLMGYWVFKHLEGGFADIA